jgi:hypothetical protein
MGFGDKLLWHVSKKIVDKLLVNYNKYNEKTGEYEQKWYESLSKFVIEEANIYFDNPNDKEPEFDENEQDEIKKRVFDMFLEELDIDEDDYEENEDEVDWIRFDGIISNYLCEI